MKKKKIIRSEQKKSIRLYFLLIFQLSVLAAFSVFTVFKINSHAGKNAYDSMRSAADTKVSVVREYVEDAENILSLFSSATEVRELLENPDDDVFLRRAQDYTFSFAENVNNLEGIYISKWDTKVLTHSNVSAVGITTRTGERLEFLQNKLINSDTGIYNAGIIVSPASDKKVLSMYMVIYGNDGEPLGLTGLGIYTSALLSKMNTKEMYGFSKADYYMLDCNTEEYIFYGGSEDIPEDLSGDRGAGFCEKLKKSGTDEDFTDFFRYHTDEGEKISICSFMAEEGWIIMINDTVEEVMKLNRITNTYLVVFLAVFLIIMIMLCYSISVFRNSVQKESAEKEIKYQKKIDNIMATLDKNDMMFSINITRDCFIEEEGTRKHLIFHGDKALEKIAEVAKLHIPEENQRENVVNTVSREYLLEQYGEGNREIRLTFRYRTSETDENITVRLMRLYMFGNPQSEDVEATLIISDITDSYYRQKAGDFLIDNRFKVVGILNVRSERFRVLGMEGMEKSDYTRSYSEINRHFSEESIPEHCRAEFLELISPENIRRKLRGRKKYSFRVDIKSEDDSTRAVFFEFCYMDSTKKYILVLVSEDTDEVL